MPVEAACPSCEGKFRLPDAAAGKKIRCPKCKGPLDVPPLSAPPPEPAAAVSPPQPAPTPAVAPPAPAAENLKSTWRSASQEPAPTEAPRKETPRAETPKPQPQPQQPAVPVFTEPAKSAITKPKPQPAPSDVVQKKAAVPNPATLPISAAPTTPTPGPKPKPPELATPPAAAPATAPPPERWFLKGEDGETFGPVDRATLDSWHDEGRLTADSQLLVEGTEQWQWASDVYPDLEEPELTPEPVVTKAAESSIHTEQAAASAANSLSRQSQTKAKAVIPVDDDEDASETEELLSPHSKPVAFLLALTLGMFGIHRFYLGYVGIGLAMFFTFGGLLMWSITDALRILFGHVTDSEGLKLRD